jgi:hypothetical protein
VRAFEVKGNGSVACKARGGESRLHGRPSDGGLKLHRQRTEILRSATVAVRLPTWDWLAESCELRAATVAPPETLLLTAPTGLPARLIPTLPPPPPPPPPLLPTSLVPMEVRTALLPVRVAEPGAEAPGGCISWPSCRLGAPRLLASSAKAGMLFAPLPFARRRMGSYGCPA